MEPAECAALFGVLGGKKGGTLPITEAAHGLWRAQIFQREDEVVAFERRAERLTGGTRGLTALEVGELLGPESESKDEADRRAGLEEAAPPKAPARTVRVRRPAVPGEPQLPPPPPSPPGAMPPVPSAMDSAGRPPKSGTSGRGPPAAPQAPRREGGDQDAQTLGASHHDGLSQDAVGPHEPSPEVLAIARRCQKMEGLDVAVDKVLHASMSKRATAYTKYEDANTIFMDCICTGDFERIMVLMDEHDDIDAFAWSQRQRDKRYADGEEVLNGIVAQLESVLDKISDNRRLLQEELRTFDMVSSDEILSPHTSAAAPSILNEPDHGGAVKAKRRASTVLRAQLDAHVRTLSGEAPSELSGPRSDSSGDTDRPAKPKGGWKASFRKLIFSRKKKGNA